MCAGSLRGFCDKFGPGWASPSEAGPWPARAGSRVRGLRGRHGQDPSQFWRLIERRSVFREAVHARDTSQDMSDLSAHDLMEQLRQSLSGERTAMAEAVVPRRCYARRRPGSRRADAFIVACLIGLPFCGDSSAGRLGTSRGKAQKICTRARRAVHRPASDRPSLERPRGGAPFCVRRLPRRAPGARGHVARPS